MNIIIDHYDKSLPTKRKIEISEYFYLIHAQYNLFYMPIIASARSKREKLEEAS